MKPLMPTRDILQRTFYIKYLNYTGTAFTIERNDKQYLVSTSHTFPFAENGDVLKISVMRYNVWNEIEVKIFKHSNTQVDIAMLQLNNDISPRHFNKTGREGLVLGKEAFFIGFPYGNFMDDATAVNDGYPLPFVKKGVVSALYFHHGTPERIYLDGINNPGFSGGPCVIRLNPNDVCTVFGVVKGYLPDNVDVKTPFGEYSFNQNSGIVEVHFIRHIDEIVIN
jgi:hypothetical protein